MWRIQFPIFDRHTYLEVCKEGSYASLFNFLDDKPKELQKIYTENKEGFFEECQKLAEKWGKKIFQELKDAGFVSKEDNFKIWLIHGH
jgi:hypothetical protein